MDFPENFVWGTATSSYQIEGNIQGDGKGPSIWDEFCKKKGAVDNKDSGDIACQHSLLFREDVALMKKMGLPAYRFSVSWPRILPEGKKFKVNYKGLDFYDQLVDCLCEAGIDPYATLFHWDFPLALHLQGGWFHEDSSKWFADYTYIVVERLKDRVKNWITLNEPNVFLPYGYALGDHAPGERRSHRELLRLHRNILLSHGKAVTVIRHHDPRARIGLAPALNVIIPLGDDPSTVEEARKRTFSADEKGLGDNDHIWKKISWWTDPIFRGTYPEGASLQGFHEETEILSPREFEWVRAPVDFLGLNIYSGYFIDFEDDHFAFKRFPPGFPRTALGWPVVPQSLYWGTRFLFERYTCPLMIAENGMAGTDWVHEDGKIHDGPRIDFLKKYLKELRRAIQDGVDIRSYFLWSLIDNFEWTYGYGQRFGLVHVDFSTQQRTLKDSAFWYQQVIASRGKSLDD